MNKLAYTTLIAFVSSILTLVGAAWLVPTFAQTDSEGRVISLEELAENNHADSCWKAIDGRVYDITDYIDDHPTPASVLTDWCGKESTDAWYDKGNGRPHSPGAQALLVQFDIGALEGHEGSSPVAETEQQTEATTTTTATPAAAATPVASSAPSAGQIADGSYYAESDPDSRGWIAVLEFTVKNGQIVSAGFDEIQRNEEGQVVQRKSSDLNYADRWRNVSGISQLSAYPALAHQLMQSGSADGVDGISGATSAHDSFTRLAKDLMQGRTAVPMATATGYRDGTYYAESDPDGRGWIALLEVSIHQGEIVAARYDEVQRGEDGAITQRKSSDYNYAERWRRVSGISQLTAFAAYENQLINKGSPDQVDALSGATSSYDSFSELAQSALADAGSQASAQNATLADGSYYAESEPSSRGLNAILEMTVKNGQIMGVYFDEIRRSESGSIEYRKFADLDYADRWRRVSGVSQLSAFPALGAQLMQSGRLAEVDATSGATSAHDAFSALASELMGEQQALAIARVESQGYRDGSYYAESEPDSRGWHALVEITVVNGRIASVYYDEIQRDDEGVFQTRKSDDLNYADRWRRVSQVSQLSAFDGYENLLLLTGTIDEVDALTGATSAYESFDQLVREALAEAR
ncbi:MAG: FMN-binding protein [Saccharospirillum sp.]|nr:FMN-binding protein [Saccharospirillum sp.]